PKFQQGGYPAFQPDAAGGWLRGTGDHLEQGALARAVDPDDAQRLSWVDLEVHVLQHPAQLMAGGPWGQPFGQSGPACRILTVGLAQPGNENAAHQSSSTISPARLRNSDRASRHSSTEITAMGQRVSHCGQVACTKMVW